MTGLEIGFRHIFAYKTIIMAINIINTKWDLIREERCDRERLLMSNKMSGSITHIHNELRGDGRCKHGMLEMQCSYCKGIPMTKYPQSVGAASFGA